LIVYASRTGNVRHIVSKLDTDGSYSLEEMPVAERPFLLVTYTDMLGQVPQPVLMYMLKNHAYCVGVVASGNNNFGHANFAKSADILSIKFNIPIVRKLDLRGSSHDYLAIQEFYNEKVKK